MKKQFDFWPPEPPHVEAGTDGFIEDNPMRLTRAQFNELMNTPFGVSDELNRYWHWYYSRGR